LLSFKLNATLVSQKISCNKAEIKKEKRIRMANGKKPKVRSKPGWVNRGSGKKNSKARKK
jgi:hypothetical protein